MILLKGGQAVQKVPNPINETTKKQQIDKEKEIKKPTNRQPGSNT